MPVRLLAQTRHGHELADGLLGRLAWPRQGLQKPFRLKSLYLDRSWAACLGPFPGTLAFARNRASGRKKGFWHSLIGMTADCLITNI
jgi:hypothetical protein